MISRFQLGVLLLLGSMCVSVLQAEALASNVWYVKPYEERTSDGAGTSPAEAWNGFENIEWGKVSDGDRLSLVPGVYRESLLIGDRERQGLRIDCMGSSDDCVIDGEMKRRNGIRVMNVDRLDISSLTFRHHKQTGLKVINGTIVEVDDVVSHDNRYYGISYEVNDGKRSGVVIKDSVTHGNGSDGWGAGIYVTARSGATLSGVQIHDNRSYDNRGRFGIIIYPKNDGTVRDFSIYNNFVYRNGSTGIDVSKRVSSGRIYDNVAEDNGLDLPGAGIHTGGVPGIGARDIDIFDNTVRGQKLWRKDGAGILVDSHTGEINVTNNHVSGSEEAGIKVHGAYDVIVESNVILDNPKGIHTPSSTTYTLTNNIVSGSGSFGVLLASTTKAALIDRNLVAESGIGVRNNVVKGEMEVRNNCLIGNATNYRSKKHRKDDNYHGNIVIDDADADLVVSRTVMSCFDAGHPCRPVMSGLQVRERSINVSGQDIPAFRVTACE